MTPRPPRGTPAGDATLAIQKLARETGADVQELQTLYALEALLARIAASPHLPFVTAMLMSMLADTRKSPEGTPRSLR